MTELSIDLNWARTTAALKTGEYETSHDISFNGAYAVSADAAPDWGGDPASVNPEQTIAASLSSCHMMTFLSVAARADWPVATYYDHAVAQLGKADNGRMAVTEIKLAPRVTFDTGFRVTPDDLIKMHQKAHKLCFVANSVSAAIKIEPSM